MTAKPTLIVDDEKNIRLALSMALEQLDIPVETAASGEEALEKIAAGGFGVMLLDLRMPGLDGMEVLRRVSYERPEIKVIIITAYGSIDLAVEAMKLGAVDFLQKPFEVAKSGRWCGASWKNKGKRVYEDYLALAKERISEGYFDIAGVYAQKAVFLDPKRPEALNLLGGISEATGNRLEAYKYYRAALAHDPAYLPAQLNLERVAAQPYTQQGIIWGDPDQGKKSRPENKRRQYERKNPGNPSTPEIALTPEEILQGKVKKKERLGQWLATAICGNDITSSCLYVSGIAISICPVHGAPWRSCWWPAGVVSLPQDLYRSGGGPAPGRRGLQLPAQLHPQV